MDKQCSTCKAVKSTDLFYKNRTKSMGLDTRCKECAKKGHAKYTATDEYKQIRDIYNKSPARKARQVVHNAKYRQTPAGKESRSKGNAKYKKTPKGRISAINRAATYKEKHPYKIKAHTSVNYAIAKGLIIKPIACSECLEACKLHGHHDDYNKPLSVRWLCAPCHQAWHRENQAIQHVGASS